MNTAAGVGAELWCYRCCQSEATAQTSVEGVRRRWEVALRIELRRHVVVLRLLSVWCS
jgi:hypothetical protein